ncbi:MAG: hypothetical protein KTM48_03560 [Wolbachia endosymbiont of Pissodes strobi]|nr:hypothetical protein [Wolbachia endosymbiont of Pissodes strobi]
MFNTKTEALEILRNRSKLENTGTYIKYDQTLMQREYRREKLQELKSRQNRGEENLKIK